MDRKEVVDSLGPDWTAMEMLIGQSLGTDVDLLLHTNRSIIENSGKKLRPMLSLLVARACNGGRTEPASIQYAAATEILHNATLIHDDVVDKSDLRRGRPTVHTILGDVSSVLVGDFWLAAAMNLLLFEHPHREEVMHLFSKAIMHLAEGEMLQLQKSREQDTTEEDYLAIIYDKTASLFEAACVSAALSVNAPEELKEAAGRYAVSLGMAFQIKDDILDYTTDASLGKPVGTDLRERKITLPLLGALRCADERTVREIREKVGRAGEEPGLCDEIYGFVQAYGGVQYAQDRLEEYVEAAKAALEPFRPSKERDFLMELADYNSSRRY